MSPLKRKKLSKIRFELDKLDNSFIKLIKKRTNLVKKVLALKEKKNQIVDYNRIKIILKNIRKKSLRNNIDPILLDRMTIIDTKPLSLNDKKIVTRDHLIPQLTESVDLEPSEIQISEEQIECHFYRGKILDIENLQQNVHEKIIYAPPEELYNLRIFDGDEQVIDMLK